MRNVNFSVFEVENGFLVQDNNDGMRRSECSRTWIAKNIDELHKILVEAVARLKEITPKEEGNLK